MMNRVSVMLTNILFPPVCELCEALCEPGKYVGICQRCRGDISLMNGPFCVCAKPVPVPGTRCHDCHREFFHFDRALACLPYQGKVKQLILSYKYRGRKRLKTLFSSYMNARLADQAIAFDAVVPVPMDKKKMVSRGFSPARLLAGEVARQSGKPLLNDALSRRKSGPSQSWLNKRRRSENIRGSFKVNADKRLSGKSLLLVDDILTTGQTASECARILKEAGAASVTVLACARGIGS